jgi:predicted amidohydrolase YtcJ
MFCCAVVALAALVANSAQSRSATLILLNGKIWTENPRQPESEAVGIEGNLVMSVGPSASIRKLAGPDCKIIDLGGRRVVPGFNDSHVHLLDGGSSLISVPLGAVLAFGSDWPVAPLDPLIGIYAAATRRTLDGKNAEGWIPKQRITVAEAVHAYTVGSAFAEHQEKVKGSIESGKLADLVVLTDDIFRIAPTDLDKVRVYMTVFDGSVIYQQGGRGLQ